MRRRPCLLLVCLLLQACQLGRLLLQLTCLQLVLLLSTMSVVAGEASPAVQAAAPQKLCCSTHCGCRGAWLKSTSPKPAPACRPPNGAHACPTVCAYHHAGPKSLLDRLSRPWCLLLHLAVAAASASASTAALASPAAAPAACWRGLPCSWLLCLLLVQGCC
jgi:hypothetical protein